MKPSLLFRMRLAYRLAVPVALAHRDGSIGCPTTAPMDAIAPVPVPRDASLSSLTPYISGTCRNRYHRRTSLPRASSDIGAAASFPGEVENERHRTFSSGPPRPRPFKAATRPEPGTERNPARGFFPLAARKAPPFLAEQKSRARVLRCTTAAAPAGRGAAPSPSPARGSPKGREGRGLQPLPETLP
jgi:hypothetical protein